MRSPQPLSPSLSLLPSLACSLLRRLSSAAELAFGEENLPLASHLLSRPLIDPTDHPLSS